MTLSGQKRKSANGPQVTFGASIAKANNFRAGTGASQIASASTYGASGATESPWT
jgi:hypothetical protein